MTLIISSAILGISFLGITAVLLRKIPALTSLPRSAKRTDAGYKTMIKKGVRSVPGLRSFSYDLFLQKLLSKFRVLTMKTENKTAGLLERMREKNNHKTFKDGYWKELKKAKKGK